MDKIDITTETPETLKFLSGYLDVPDLQRLLCFLSKKEYMGKADKQLVFQFVNNYNRYELMTDFITWLQAVNIQFSDLSLSFKNKPFLIIDRWSFCVFASTEYQRNQFVDPPVIVTKIPIERYGRSELLIQELPLFQKILMDNENS